MVSAIPSGQKPRLDLAETRVRNFLAHFTISLVNSSGKFPVENFPVENFPWKILLDEFPLEMFPLEKFPLENSDAFCLQVKTEPPAPKTQ